MDWRQYLKFIISFIIWSENLHIRILFHHCHERFQFLMLNLKKIFDIFAILFYFILLVSRSFSWSGFLMFFMKAVGILTAACVSLSGQLPVEYMRGKPLCMELYPLLFSSSRIPGPKHDYVARYSNSRRSPTHITVVRNYQVGRAGAWLALLTQLQLLQ